MKTILLAIIIASFALPVFSQGVNQEWVRTYNGTENGHDEAYAMAVDAAGNVYVAGRIFVGPPFWSKGVLLKYNTSGDLLWEVMSDSITMNLITVDESGYIYVAGIYYTGGYAVEKYNPSGVMQWRHSHTASGSLEETVAMTIDASGNVYVTGQTWINGNGFDYKTVKVNSTGSLGWIRTYNGSDSHDDYVRGIAVDGSGNVFVTGEVRESENPRTRIGTIKYSSSGTLLWVRTWIETDFFSPNAAGITIDNNGNVYIAGSAVGPSSDPHNYWRYYVTLKYNSVGGLVWTQIYEGIGGFNCSDNWINAITSDNDGNVYITGGSMPNNCKVEIVTIKYNSGGAVQWVSRFIDPNGEDNEGMSIKVDNDGNVFVLGYSYEAKILFIKYNSFGHQLWYAKNPAPYGNNFFGLMFGIDNLGNVYISGSFQGAETGYDIVTIKYSDGTPLVITKPLLNEKWMAGETDTIRWTGGQEEQYVIIEFSLDNGDNYDILNVSVPADSGFFVWKVTDTLLTTKAKIKITDLFNPNLKSESSVFRIKPYILTRIDENGDYYEYRKNRDQFGFSNTAADMWPQTWWQQFDYQGIDPFTGSQYSQWQCDFAFATSVSAEHMDWISWVNTFGINANYYSTLLGIYKNSAILKWKSKHDIWNGSCFGIAVANALAFSHKEQFVTKYPSFPDSTYPISVASNDGVKRVVNELYTHQLGNPHQTIRSNIGLSKTPTETLNDLKSMLKEDISEIRTLSFLNNGVGGGGHAILAYGLDKDPVNPNIYHIKVYDNSSPNSNNRIQINTAANGGNGTWTNPDWPGWGGNKWIYLRNPTTEYLETPIMARGVASQSPFILDQTELQIMIKSEGSTKIINNLGNITGFYNNTLQLDVPGSVPLIVDNPVESPPYGYSLQTDVYSVLLTEFEADKVETFFFTGNKSFVYERSGAIETQTDRLFFDGGLSVTNPDVQTKTIKLLNLLDENTQEKLTVLKGIDLAQNDSVKIENLDSNIIKLISYGTAKEYDLELNYLNESVSDRFIAENLLLPENSSHIFVPFWTDLMNTELMLLTDIGNNGIIDDTTFIDNVLPVDLISFDAIVDDRDVILSWKTAWEVNNDRFEIFRKSANDENAQWIKAGVKPGSGNTNEPRAYSFIDKNLTTGKYEYKLVQYDYNGMSSADIDLNTIIEIGIPVRFELYQNYPNPFNPVTKIDFAIPVEGMTKLVIYDLSGREVATLVNDVLTPGYYTAEFNAVNMASGVYFYRLVTNNNVMTKRMVLLK